MFLLKPNATFYSPCTCGVSSFRLKCRIIYLFIFVHAVAGHTYHLYCSFCQHTKEGHIHILVILAMSLTKYRLLINLFNPDSAKSKTDTFTKLQTGQKLKDNHTAQQLSHDCHA